MKVFDCFPFFNELDVLEIRLNELDSVVDVFVILESGETYGGSPKPMYLLDNWERFEKFAHKILHVNVPTLQPPCTDRTTGRLREAYQRDKIMPALQALGVQDSDVVIFSDCDEIPRAETVRLYIDSGRELLYRFKQRSFYYTVNRLVDYGHDFASRARIGHFGDMRAVGGPYAFRMAKKNTEEYVLENGGWHFGYFNNGTGIEHIKTKVASLNTFLTEYKLYGDQQLVRDIVEGKDLHHRRCELPETFTRCASDDPTLPKHYLDNREKFAHFTEEWYREQYAQQLKG